MNDTDEFGDSRFLKASVIQYQLVEESLTIVNYIEKRTVISVLMFWTSICIEGLKQWFSREPRLSWVWFVTPWAYCTGMKELSCATVPSISAHLQPLGLSCVLPSAVLMLSSRVDAKGASVSHAVLSQGILVALATETRRNLQELDRLNY
jgi:hypothetical protein